MKKFKIWLLLLAVLLLAVGAGFFGLVQREQAQAGDAKIQTAKAGKRDLSSTVLATGTIKPESGAEAEINSRISGTVKIVPVKIGDQVETGQILLELETEELEIQLAKAQADFQAAEVKLAQLLNGARPEEREQAKNGLRQAEVNLENARRNLKRQQELYEREAITEQQLEAAQKELALAEVQFKNAQQQLALAENKYTAEDAAAAKAQVEQARANVQNAELQLAYTQVKSPIAGTISSLAASPGEVVGKDGSTPLAAVIDLNRLQIEAYVDETEIGRVTVGQRAEISIDAFPQDEFSGTVTAISPQAIVDGNAVYYVVTVALGNPDARLRPDLTADVAIFVEERKAVLAVPSEAIKREGGQQVVYVIKDDSYEARPITTGWRDAQYTEVKAGIQEGDRVLLGDPEQSNGKESKQ